MFKGIGLWLFTVCHRLAQISLYLRFRSHLLDSVICSNFYKMGIRFTQRLVSCVSPAIAVGPLSSSRVWWGRTVGERVWCQLIVVSASCVGGLSMLTRRGEGGEGQDRLWIAVRSIQQWRVHYKWEREGRIWYLTPDYDKPIVFQIPNFRRWLCKFLYPLWELHITELLFATGVFYLLYSLFTVM